MLLGEGEDRAQLIGIVDRVDGYVRGDKLYLRVVDYKTGGKSFSLSDVWYGMGLQMLLYLFALTQDGAERYGREIVPAGVMYVPARSAIVSCEADESEDKIEKKRRDALRRSGLVLGEDELIEAWEKGAEKLYIPLKKKSGEWNPESIATSEQMGRLYRHIRHTLAGMAGELRGGVIAADPVFDSHKRLACEFCDFPGACRFAEGEAGEKSRVLRKLGAEEVWTLMEGEEEL